MRSSEIVCAELGLDVYPNQIEVITAEQMLDAYASRGMPLSTGIGGPASVSPAQDGYRGGLIGPGLRNRHQFQPLHQLLMEENTTAMQALVIAHAAFGHNRFFKATTSSGGGPTASASSTTWISPELYAECEDRHGSARSSDARRGACAERHGVYRYRRATKLNLRRAGEAPRPSDWNTTRRTRSTISGAPCPARRPRASATAPGRRVANASAPCACRRKTSSTSSRRTRRASGWQREVVRIVRKIAQYSIRSVRRR